MFPVGFEPTISVGERPQTYTLDRAATGTGTIWNERVDINCLKEKKYLYSKRRKRGHILGNP